MPVHVNPDLPGPDFRVIDETAADFTIAFEIPKAAIVRHRRFLEMLLEAVARQGGDDA